MFYKIGIVTVFLAWVLNRTHVFPRYQFHVVFMGNDVGLYITHIFLFLIIWVLFFLFENAFGRPAWMDAMNSHQGSSGWMDWIVISVCCCTLAVSIGANTLTPSLLLIAMLGIGSAIYSLLLGRELRLQTRISEQTSLTYSTEPNNDNEKIIDETIEQSPLDISDNDGTNA
jgi:hypothetical protein